MSGVTMLITTFNRAALLRRSLERLCHLTHPDELIIVDDGGADETREVCAEFADRLGIGQYIYNNNPGQTICSLARNIGVREAEHEFIMTSEPELIFLTDVVAQFKALTIEYPNDVVSSGHVYFLPEGHQGDAPPDPCEAGVGWVAPHTAIYRKSWLEDVGGWDEGFPGPWGWDDTDLLTRLRIAGHGQHIDHEVRAMHQFHGYSGDPGRMNEAYFMSKGLHTEPVNHDQVVANRDREWGKVRTRPT